MKSDTASESQSEQQIFDRSLEKFSSILAQQGLAGVFEACCTQFTQRPAFTDGVTILTFEQLYAQAQAGAAAIAREYHLNPGDVVVLRMHNSIEFIRWYFSALLAGAVIIPVSPQLHQRELLSICQQAGVKMLVSELATDHESFMGLCAVVKAELIASYITSAARKLITRPGTEPAVYLFTSASTADPRGVVLSAENIVINALQSCTRMWFAGLNAERFVAVLPFAHSFGHMSGIWMPLISGSQVWLVDVFKRSTIQEIFAKFKPTIFFGVPIIFGVFATLPRLQTESVKLFISGGDYLTVAIREAFALVHGRIICSGYGLSEASPVVALEVAPEGNHYCSVGTPLVGIDIRIVPLAHHENKSIGELLVRGPNVMLRYLNGDMSQIIVDGWLKTGDLATLRDGTLYIIGREKEVIIYKGFNIYPQEIEQALLRHPAVQQVLAFGIDDAAAGQLPVAVVVARPQVKLSSEDLIAHAKKELTPYKVPHKIYLLAQMPMMQSGKLDRRTVKKMVTERVD